MRLSSKEHQIGKSKNRWLLRGVPPSSSHPSLSFSTSFPSPSSLPPPPNSHRLRSWISVSGFATQRDHFLLGGIGKTVNGSSTGLDCGQGTPGPRFVDIGFPCLRVREAFEFKTFCCSSSGCSGTLHRFPQARYPHACAPRLGRTRWTWPMKFSTPSRVRLKFCSSPRQYLSPTCLTFSQARYHRCRSCLRRIRRLPHVPLELFQDEFRRPLCCRSP